MSGIYSLLSAAKGQQRRMEATSNNLANVNTPGFKGDRAIFREYLADVTGQDLESEEELFSHNEFISPFSKGGNSMVLTDEIVPNLASGSYKATNNSFDLALKSDGFFSVKTPQGIRYTRNGQFTKDNKGFLVTQDGGQVLGKKGPIKITGSKFTVGVDGSVNINGKQIDTLKVVNFNNPHTLSKMGNSYWVPSHASQKATELSSFSVQQGMLEGSNVNTVSEMVNMIAVNRGYEATHKAIRTIDELDDKSISMARV